MSDNSQTIGKIERPSLTKGQFIIWIGHVVDGCAFSFARFANTEDDINKLKDRMRGDRDQLKRDWVELIWVKQGEIKVWDQWGGEFMGVIAIPSLRSGLNRLAAADSDMFNRFVNGSITRSDSSTLLKYILHI